MAWFHGVPEERSASPADVGLLLVNLGTPAHAGYASIRRYLGRFLGDRRVVEACPAYWYPILYGPILALRPLRTARLYRRIWLPEGSPLLVHSRRLAERVQAAYPQQQVRVELAMTYGEPSIAAAVRRLQAACVRRLVVLPLYPQYSGSTSGAVFDALARELCRWRRVPELAFIAEYHADPAYIEALADSVRAAWAVAGGRSHLVCSYHGIPVKYVERGDPYPAQVATTTRLLVQALGLADGEWSQTFQSRFGPATWLAPATDEVLAAKARSGSRAVTVVTPSFAVDCLETLEEIGVESRRRFLAAGGESFTLVPALNDSPAHAAALAALLRRHGVPAAADAPPCTAGDAVRGRS